MDQFKQEALNDLLQDLYRKEHIWEGNGVIQMTLHAALMLEQFFTQPPTQGGSDGPKI